MCGTLVPATVKSEYYAALPREEVVRYFYLCEILNVVWEIVCGVTGDDSGTRGSFGGS